MVGIYGVIEGLAYRLGRVRTVATGNLPPPGAQIAPCGKVVGRCPTPYQGPNAPGPRNFPIFGGGSNNYLSDTGDLLSLSGMDGVYITNGLKDIYVTGFKKQGAATEDKFADQCRVLFTDSTISLDPHAVAVTILNYLVSKNIVRKEELSEKGITLFVCKEIIPGSKFVRREISLDD